jgi:enoyl-CoA hydratase/carnithine racemase
MSLIPAAMEMARTISRNSPLAVSASKRAIRLAFDLPLADGLAYESQMFALSFDTADQAEGMSAFAAKRTAEFTGA